VEELSSTAVGGAPAMVAPAAAAEGERDSAAPDGLAADKCTIPSVRIGTVAASVAAKEKAADAPPLAAELKTEAWSEQHAFRLVANSRLRQLFAGKVPLFEDAGSSALATSRLNSGELQCPEDLCLAHCKEQGAFFLFYKPSAKDAAVSCLLSALDEPTREGQPANELRIVTQQPSPMPRCDRLYSAPRSPQAGPQDADARLEVGAPTAATLSWLPPYCTPPAATGSIVAGGTTMEQQQLQRQNSSSTSQFPVAAALQTRLPRTQRWRLVCSFAEGMSGAELKALPEESRAFCFDLTEGEVAFVGREHQLNHFEAWLPDSSLRLNVSRTQLQLLACAEGLSVRNVGAAPIGIDRETMQKGQSRSIDDGQVIKFTRHQCSGRVCFLALELIREVSKWTASDPAAVSASKQADETVSAAAVEVEGPRLVLGSRRCQDSSRFVLAAASSGSKHASPRASCRLLGAGASSGGSGSGTAQPSPIAAAANAAVGGGEAVLASAVAVGAASDIPASAQQQQQQQQQQHQPQLQLRLEEVRTTRSEQQRVQDRSKTAEQKMHQELLLLMLHQSPRREETEKQFAPAEEQEEESRRRQATDVVETSKAKVEWNWRELSPPVPKWAKSSPPASPGMTSRLGGEVGARGAAYGGSEALTSLLSREVEDREKGTLSRAAPVAASRVGNSGALAPATASPSPSSRAAPPRACSGCSDVGVFQSAVASASPSTGKVPEARSSEVVLELCGDGVQDVPLALRRIGPFALDASPLLVGRRHQPGLHMDAIREEFSQFIEREHFAIAFQAADYFLVALSSSGVWRDRDGERPVLVERDGLVPLKIGDRIALPCGEGTAVSALRALCWHFRLAGGAGASATATASALAPASGVSLSAAAAASAADRRREDWPRTSHGQPWWLTPRVPDSGGNCASTVASARTSSRFIV